MIFQELALAGAYLVESDRVHDTRGSFARTFCREEFAYHGLSDQIAQANLGYSKRRGTIRGLHYQVAPFEEQKLIRCSRGRIFDVMVDVRSGSPTFLQWVGIELSAATNRMVVVPPGAAHGYQALEDGTEIVYAVSAPYAPAHERGIRWDDPAIGIDWPIREGVVVSEKDRHWPLVAPLAPGRGIE